MIKRMVTSALFAGAVAGLLAAALQFAFLQKFILLAEAYETGAAVHFAGVPNMQDAPAPTAPEAAIPDAAGGTAMPMATSDTAETSTFERNAWTTLFAGLVYVAYGLILAAGFSLAEAFGRSVSAREGLIWGIAGFAAVQLFPAMGLAPQLPGIPAADLAARQVWWWGTVASAVVALGLIAYGKGIIAPVVAVILLAAPHIIGAPALDGFGGVTPPEISATFSARVLGAGFVAWAALGWLAGWFWNRKSA